MNEVSIRKNVDLTALNTLRVPVCAEYFAKGQSKKQIKQIVSEVSPGQNVFVLGGGSNVLFLTDYNGLVIQPDVRNKKIVDETNEHIWLRVGAGENWHKLVRYCVQKGWGGIENLSLIPGRTGAAPIQNIGAYGAELADVFHSLTAVNITDGSERIFKKEDCNFGYRDSIFKQELKNKFIITDVTLRLDKKPEVNTSYGSLTRRLQEKGIDQPTVEQMSNTIVEIRNGKLPDPTETANAGSFFKNPVVENKVFESLQNEFPGMPHYKMDGHKTKIPAGWLIEKCGWKGTVKGNVGVYEQQALVIINKGGATGKEILSVADEIQQSVSKKFGIALAPEVNIVNSSSAE